MSRHLHSRFEEFGDPLLHPDATLQIQTNRIPEVVALAPVVLGVGSGRFINSVLGGKN